jgi:hypothetical protein
MQIYHHELTDGEVDRLITDTIGLGRAFDAFDRLTSPPSQTKNDA